MDPGRVGELVRAARRDRAMSPDVVAARAEVSRRDLKQWERGQAKPTAAQLDRIAAALGLSPDELIPPREPVAYHPATGTLTVGARTAAIVRRAQDADENAAVLRTYVGAVAASRGCPPATSIPLRRDDIEVLSQLLDLDDADLQGRLQALLGLSPAAAAAARGHLLSRRAAAVAAAATVAVLASGSLAAAAAGGGGSSNEDVPSGRAPAAVTTTTVVATEPAAPVVVAAAEAPAADEPAPPTTTAPHAVSPVQLPDDADGDGIDIGDALVIERGTPPADPGTQIGDAYTYER